MSLFLPNIPTANQTLDFSQGQLLSNNQGLDTVFAIEHYKFSDATASKGFHNTVTTPRYETPPTTGTPSATPAPTGSDPVLYAFQQTANLGAIQYSRGPTNAVPTPITAFHSAAPFNLAGNASQNILDFSGVARAFGTILYIGDGTVPVSSQAYQYAIFWDGANFRNVSVANNAGANAKLLITSTGSVLQVRATGAAFAYNNISYTLSLVRTS